MAGIPIRTLLATISAVAALFVFQPVVFAEVVQMHLTNPPPGDILYNVYIGPYSATINGVSTTVICDDFLDDVYSGEQWKATQYDGSADLSTTRVANLYTGNDLSRAYDAAAWLAIQLVQPNASVTARGYLSYAIWDIFADTNAKKPAAPSVPQWLHSFAGRDTFYANNVKPLVQAAFANAPIGERSVLTVYSPTTDPPTCGNGGCPTSPAQEFLVVKTPEAQAAAILAFNLSALMAIAFLVRRRIVWKYRQFR